MAQLYNSELTKEIREGGKIQISRDSIPTQLAEKVVPVMEVNPKLLRKCSILATATNTSTTATVITLDSNKDFYLCGGNLSVIKDVTSPSTFSAIIVSPVELANNLAFLSIAGITLTPQSETMAIDLARPIQLKRGSAISLTNTSATANVLSRCSIWGYYDESSNA